MKAYFAEDGNYGCATDLVIIDVSKWSEDDWNRIEIANDQERIYTAKQIDREHRNDK